MNPKKIGSVQLEIMKLLWTWGEMTAREVTDALAERGNLAHSTVQTLLRKLEAKGAIDHAANGRLFVFRPLWREEETTQSATKDLLGRVFDGSITRLVSHLLKNEKVSPDELSRLRKLIDDASESQIRPDVSDTENLS